MKFHCSTREQRLQKKVQKMKKWRTRFLFVPVRINENECRWLEFYRERYMNCYVYQGIWDSKPQFYYSGYEAEYKNRD